MEKRFINKTSEATMWEIIGFPTGFIVGIMVAMIITLIIKDKECLA